jgi:hypothetical protein
VSPIADSEHNCPPPVASGHPCDWGEPRQTKAFANEREELIGLSATSLDEYAAGSFLERLEGGSEWARWHTIGHAEPKRLNRSQQAVAPAPAALSREKTVGGGAAAPQPARGTGD